MTTPLWVTGLGLVTPLGAGVEATWSRLVRGERAIRPLTLFSDAAPGAIAAQVEGFAWPDGDRPDAASRTSEMARAAAAEALQSAGVDAARDRVGLVVGGTTGGMLENEQVLADLHADPTRREAIAPMLSHPLSAVGDWLERRLGPFVRVRTLASACSSGASAIVAGAAWLLAGEVDVVLAGGADGLCRLTLNGFAALGALDPEPCRPFDRRRRGTSLGEGAAFLVLERADRASRRASGVRPVARLAGWALGAEAHHITNPAADGALVASLVERAMARAGIGPREVDYVNAHGTGTTLNDAMEAAALARALGGEITRVPVSSSKGQIGHTLGAAGAIEAAVTALVVDRRVLAPTAGLDEPDPALPLVHVPHAGREVPRVRAALSNAFGFGGMDAVLLFTEAREEDAGAGRPPASPPATPAAQRVVLTGAAVFGVCGLVADDALASLVERRFTADAPVDPDAHLDAARSRRLDRAARLATVAVERAWRQAGAPPGAGVLLGGAYGNVDGSAGFMRRVFERGPRAASPAEFPNLVPSSPVGHVSIYLGLNGPTLATADLATSGESAIAQALQLVGAGESPQLVAGGAEPRSDIVERVFALLFAHTPSQRRAPRTDASAAVAVESEAAAAARGARVLARVRQVIEWRGRDGRAALGALVEPRAPRVEIVQPRHEPQPRQWLGESAWGRAAHVWACAPALGESDALGAVAVAVAASRLGAGLVDEALVLGVACGRGYALVLEGPR